MAAPGAGGLRCLNQNGLKTIFADIRANWQTPFGDCRQELVFIGQNIDADKARQELDWCLLSDDELAAGKDSWITFPDHFPVVVG